MQRATQVVVVVFALGVTSGLLLVAVVRVRERATREGCRNNLRGIAIALENYHDGMGSFPAASLANPALPPHRRLSWLFELDPFVHARMDPEWGRRREGAWDDEDNLDLARGRMPWFVCPSRPHGAAGGLAPTHYVGIAGVGDEAAGLPEGDRRAGVFGHDRRTRREDIRDGLGTTLVAAETTLQNGPWVAGGWPTVRGLIPGEGPYVGAYRQFGGTHRGGSGGAFADGSVRFIPDSVSVETFEAMATMAAGDEVGPDAWE